MAVSYYPFVFATFVLSCLSAGLLIAGMATENWVSGELKREDGSTSTDLVNYGLFRGTFTTRFTIIPFENDLFMSCIYGSNACAYSCEKTSEKRKEEMEILLGGKLPEFICGTKIEADDQYPDDILWFNSGIYLTVVILCVLSILLAVFSALLGVYNTSKIAIEPMLGVFGLYIWHGVATVFELLILILWGAHMETTLKDQLGFTYTMSLRKTYTGSGVHVGFSYWLIFGAMMCHIVSEVSLIVRWWKIKMAPPPPTVALDNNTDNTIFLY